MSRYSNIIQNKRNQFKGALDEFCTFKWNDLDSWDEFGAFIIADKRGDLKVSSGPSFTNNYSKPQFESAAGQLQGITFNTKQISFKVGVYWATMEDYRKFLNWLHPYEVSDLQFSYDNDYAYFCKLAKIDDASKYIIGYQENETIYYFETNITFEIQGEACAHHKDSYSWAFVVPDNEKQKNYQQFTSTIEDGDDTIQGWNIQQSVSFPSVSSFWKKNNNFPFSELETNFKINTNKLNWGKKEWKFNILVNNNRVVTFKKNLSFNDYLTPPNADRTNSWIINVNFEYNNQKYKKITVVWGSEKLGKSASIYYDQQLVYSEFWGIAYTNELGSIYILDESVDLSNISATINGIPTTVNMYRWFKNNINFNSSLKNDRDFCGFIDFVGTRYSIKGNSESWLEGYLASMNGFLLYNKENEENLFSIKFKPNVIRLGNSLQQPYINYNSQTGVVLWGIEDILTPINYLLLWDGKKCIQSITSKNITIPGTFNYPNIDYNQIEFKVYFTVDNARFVSQNFNVTSIEKEGDEEITEEEQQQINNWIPQIIDTNVHTTTFDDGKIFSLDNLDITMYSKKIII